MAADNDMMPRAWLAGRAAGLALVLLAMTGCGDSAGNQHRNDTFEMPTVGEADWRKAFGAKAPGVCLEQAASSVPPEAAERPFYIKRKQADGTLWPINAECVARSYTPQDLRAWAGRGDPVAEIALAFDEVRAMTGECKADLAIAKRLRDSGERQERLQRSGNPIRVPEVFAVASAIYERCGDAATSKQLSEKASRNGYVYLMPRE